MSEYLIKSQCLEAIPRIQPIISSTTGPETATSVTRTASHISLPTFSKQYPSQYSYEDRGCSADCQVRYSPVTVYEWQPVLITATSTVLKLVVTGLPDSAPDMEFLVRGAKMEDDELQTKDGLPYSALTVPVIDNKAVDVPATRTLDV
jgi:hypothetical protein